MSMDVCYKCGALVDTDEGVDCYVDIGNQRRLEKIVCICEKCREEDDE